ncbi:MAG: iron-containing alcohol dehydrogenase [Candidatus Lokiarchaeota archaeon]|nr:iron-containing alcohol dehydrogenase [Candidatus Lokiarchaeota archaeon]
MEEDNSEQKPWYEDPFIQEMMGLMGARAMRSVMAGFKANLVFSGENGIADATKYMDQSLYDNEKRILVITDNFTKKFLPKMEDAFSNTNFEIKLWEGVKAEVPYETIEKGVQICKEFNPTILMAIGGGSVMDTAKIVNIKYEKPELNLLNIDAVSGSIGLHRKIKHLVAIPTTIGTGSEVTTAAVLNDTRRAPHKKIGITADDILPTIVILHPDFVKDLPPFLIMGTGLDTFAHAMGAYVSNWNNPLTTAINITAIKETLQYLPRLVKYGSKDLEGWEHMQWAALMAGLGFSNSMPGIEHALGHSFGALMEVHHGYSVGLFTPQSVAWQAKVTERWRDLCPIFEVEDKQMSRQKALESLIENIQTFIRKVGGAVAVREVKRPIIKEEDYKTKIPLMAEYALNDIAHLASYRPLRLENYLNIYKSAWNGEIIY